MAVEAVLHGNIQQQEESAALVWKDTVIKAVFFFLIHRWTEQTGFLLPTLAACLWVIEKLKDAISTQTVISIVDFQQAVTFFSFSNVTT